MAITRREVFTSLWHAHAGSWAADQFTIADASTRKAIAAWKGGWWDALEAEFPEFIQNGRVKCEFYDYGYPATRRI